MKKNLYVLIVILLMSAGNIAYGASKLGVDSDKDGLPYEVEKLLGTNPYSADTDGDGIPDKTDKNPAYADNIKFDTGNKILNLKVLDARVEDNVNADDHLEIKLKNTGKTDIKNLEIYFTVTDTVTQAKNTYYVNLGNFSIKSGKSKKIHFDNKQGDGHFPGNMNGVYGTSHEKVIFNGKIYSKGYTAVKFSAVKAKGTAEIAD